MYTLPYTINSFVLFDKIREIPIRASDPVVFHTRQEVQNMSYSVLLRFTVHIS